MDTAKTSFEDFLQEVSKKLMIDAKRAFDKSGIFEFRHFKTLNSTSNTIFLGCEFKELETLREGDSVVFSSGEGFGIEVKKEEMKPFPIRIVPNRSVDCN